MSQKDIKAKKSVLGRGLASLIEEADNDSNTLSSSNNTAAGGVSMIPLVEIEANLFQPRSYFNEEALIELAESIKVHGIIQPITVRKLGEKQYQIISGERRYRASKMAGLEAVPAYVRLANDQEILEMGIVENLQREDLNPLEVATGFKRLIEECNLKQEELGERVGKNRSTISNYLRLLKLPHDIQAGLRDELIDFGHARALINIEDVAVQLDIYKRVIAENLSVRKVEELVKNYTQNIGNSKLSRSSAKPSASGFEYKKVQDKLSNHFGTKVSLKVNDKNQGEIKIPFYSVEDFNRILEILSVI